MPFESYSLWLPKDIRTPEAYEDAFAVNEAGGIAAIGDGVSSAIYSRIWAYLLTEAIIQAPPDPNREDYPEWLQALRQEWEDQVREVPKNFFQKMKLEETGGAFTTLLWVELLPDVRPEDPELIRARCYAVGDCCLFQVRGEELITTFPLACAADFDLYPDSLASRARGAEPNYTNTELELRTGDLLFLATDAWAAWAFDEMESGRKIDWPAWQEYDNEQWQAKVTEIRNADQIRYDDTTLVILKVTAPAAAETVEQQNEELLEPATEVASGQKVMEPAEVPPEPAAEFAAELPATGDLPSAPAEPVPEVAE